MKWGRGFFRAWVVLTALWIGFTVYVQEPKTYKRLWSSAYDVKIENSRDAIEVNLAEADPAADLRTFMQEKRPDLDTATVLNDSNEILAEIKSQHQVNIGKTASALKLTIIPPLALLGLGLCMFWIARGFRPVRKP